MKSRGKFIIGILLMLVAVLVIEYRMPRRFIWQPTFSHSDAQPFGCLVFDSVMKASLPNGYTVDRRTLFQLFQDGVITYRLAGLIIIGRVGRYLGHRFSLEPRLSVGCCGRSDA